MNRGRVADVVVVAFGAAILGASAMLAALGSAGIDPIANVDLCWSRILLDRDCPGCGLTRSFVAVAGGKLSASFACNPTGPVLFAGILAITLLHALRLFGVSFRRLGRIDAIIGIAVLGTLLAHGFHFYWR